jgi:hypothetical protein
MKISIFWAIALMAAIFFQGCDEAGHQTIIGTGDVESMEVELPAFNGVNVIGVCKVDIQIGEPQTVEFYAQSEVLDVLSYEVSEETLEIGFKRGYSVNTDEEIRAEITIPSLNFTGIIGASDFELSGEQQERLDIYISGVGNVYAYDMPVKDCFIRLSGTSNCEVHVIEFLDVVISGVGNIWYRGYPTVNTDISGIGNVSPESN